MAGAVQQLTLDGLAGWADEAARRLGEPDFMPVLKTCVQILVSFTKQCFDASASPDGVPWAALKNPSKNRGGASARILYAKGLLLASVSGAGSGNVTEISAGSLLWGTSVSYASFHQGGTKYMVARPFVGISPEAADDMASAFGEWAQRQVE